MTKPIYSVPVAALCFTLSVTYGQLPVNTIGTPVTIDFAGFTGSGFAPAPSAGQLDSDTWSLLGFSTDDTLSFGETGITLDFARGISTGGEITGGVYAFDHGGSNTMLGFQPTASDFTPGAAILRILNNTGQTITKLQIDYTFFAYNDQLRATTFWLEHGPDTLSYIPVQALADTTQVVADSVPSWDSVLHSVLITGINIAQGAYYFLRWSSNDAGGSGSRDEIGIDDISITGLNDPVVAAYNASESCAGDSTWFTDASVANNGNIVSWYWDFGDGLGISTQQNPGYMYVVPGVYQCTLAVANNFGQYDTLIQPVTVHHVPQAGFVVSGSNGCAPFDVVFTDTSSVPAPDTIISYYWTFGNGDTSTLNSPIYSYTSAGSYNVMLITTGTFGCADTASLLLTANTPPIISNLTTQIDSASCSNADGNIISVGVSGNAPFTYQWLDTSFQTIDTLADLLNVSSGSYFLIVTDTNMCTDTSAYTVPANGIPDPPVFADAAPMICEGSVILFQVINPQGTITWYSDSALTQVLDTGSTFDPSILAAGTYIYYATASDLCEGAPSVLILTVNSIPSASFGVAVNGMTVTLNNTSSSGSYFWNFGDGGQSTQTNPVYTYQTGGTYVVSLVVTNQFACMDSISDTVNIVTGIAEKEDLKTLRIYPNPSSDGLITLAFNNYVPPELSIRVLNIIGREVVVREGWQNFTNKLILDLSEQPDGQYFLYLTYGNQTVSRRFSLYR